MCPTPTSIMNFLHRIKRMISSNKFSRNETNSNKNTAENPMHLNMSRIINKHNVKSNDFKSRKILDRKRSSNSNEKLTYKIVIERIVKRFLLYYKDRHGSDEKKTGFEFREIKNDLGSFHLEVFHEIDGLDEMRTSLVQSMNKFNDNLKEHFDFEQIKQHLDHRNIS